MKKLLITILILLPVSVFAYSLADRVEGEILLAVEDHGKTYYVKDGYRYRIKVDTAHKVFEELALGITDEDLLDIPEGSVDLIYKNDEYQFEYPSNLILEENSLYGFITFRQDWGYWQIYIHTEEEAPSSVEWWINNFNKEEKKEFEINEGIFSQKVISEKIIIDDVEAIVTHIESEYEEFPYEKEILFIKNDKLYRFNIRGLDDKKILDSFKFIY